MNAMPEGIKKDEAIFALKKKTTRFLLISLMLVLLLCTALFTFLAFYMSRQSQETINQVGSIYMSSTNQQISLHFKTTIELRLAQLETMVLIAPAADTGSEEELHADLAYNAKARGFDYLGFYSPDGSLEMLLGEEVEVSDPQPFLTSLQAGQQKIAVGTDAEGNRVVLLGIPAAYPMAGGGDSMALVAGLPASYISHTLFLDAEENIAYSHIIRRDGSFVIRSGSLEWENYFDRIRETFDPVDGQTAEHYVAALQAAMNAKVEYSSIYVTQGSRQHLYCSPLPYSEWYLVTVMPYGTLDQSVGRLGRLWIGMLLGCCGLLLAVLLAVFAQYFKLTRQQIESLVAARQEADRASRAKSEFLSNMSHDIRTPMNAIVGMTAIAAANIDDTAQVQHCLKKITLSSRHLLGLINDVLDMSKIESGKMTLNVDRVSLREVMDGILGIVQPQVKAKGQRFDVVLQDILVENVFCDSVRLNQVLLNLLSNAIKFTPEGGAISVTLNQRSSPKGDGYVQVQLWVRDNGIGMPKDFLKVIFDPFVREDSTRVHRTEGTGLGMAITKYIVDTMGGRIEVESTLGQGTEFSVTLDLERAPDQEEEMLLPNWRMLVVDDDQQLCETTVASLQSIGVQAEWTLDGESAVEIVQKRHAGGQDFQIILLDWKLPQMDGIKTARQIRQLAGGQIPILLISAYDWAEIEQDARDAGICGFISKPLFRSTLFYGLRQFMGDTPDAAPKAADPQSLLAGRRVLVAEDNDLNWEIAEELLSDLGLQLEWAQNGQICTEKFAASAPGFYDAILMDLRMPYMNGYEATDAIRAMDRPDAAAIPIVAMTADAFSEDVQRCLAHGMNAHVSKPIDVKEVERLLLRLLQGQE